VIQSDADLKLIATSLRARARRLRTEAKGRKWTGAQFASVRQALRAEADECIIVARRAEEALANA
jgi:hypothetical protein